MDNNYQNQKRIAKNTTFLYIRMFFVLLVSLYTSRVILNTLGVTDYGIFNVVAGFVSLFGFFNAILSSSLQRFYNFEGTQNGPEGFRSVYITGFIIHLILSIILFVALETIGLWYVNRVMVLPDDRLFAANILFQGSVLTMILVVLQTPYLGAIMAKEHMDFYAFVSIIDVVLKLIIVLILPYLPYDKLVSFSLLLILISIINFLLYYIYAKKNFPSINFKWVIYKDLFKKMMSFAGWNLIGTIAFMFKGQGINLLLNYYFGLVINAARGVAFQINHAVSGFTSNISTSFRPQIVNSIANEEYEKTCKMMFTESKVCYALICTMIVPISLEIDYILHLWLGNAVPEKTNIFTVLVLMDLLVGTLNTPLTQVVHATGNIKIYQIVSTSIYILIIPFCWIALKMGYSATSTFVICVIMSVANQIGCIFSANHIFHFGIIRYIKKVIIPLLLFTLLLPVIPWIITYIIPSSFFRLMIVLFLDAIIALCLAYLGVLNKREKELIISFIKKK